MLVLHRKKHEVIALPGLNVRIIVLGVERGKVKLGVEAPDDVNVVREELLARTPEAAA